MLRARALEQALRMLIDAAVQTACKIAEDGDRRWHVVDLVCATNDAEKLLAVDPPPSGASPQAETSDDLSELWRQELYPHVEPDTFKRFLCDLTAEGWDDVRKEVFALQSIVDSRPAPVSPVEPEPPEELPCYCDIPSHILDLGCPRHQAPQCEPEPPKTWSLGIINRTGFTVEPEPCVWRDIATVPKDGTRILLTPAVWTAERVVSAYYRLGMWWIESADARGSIRAFTDPDEDASHWPFTHWTPLPGAPLKVEREP